jgi:D-alanyl-D-alanine carboxypeptidase (penicillin-binding protein 5/6)
MDIFVRTSPGRRVFASRQRRILAVALCVMVVCGTGIWGPSGPVRAQSASTIETSAPHALLLDVNSNSTLLAKADMERMPPSSMGKLMTMVVVFDEIKAGKLRLDDTIRISEDAWRRGGAQSGGSTMYAELDSDVPVEDLIKGVTVQSGNDAAIAFAEHLAGTEEAFARLMNAKAAELGLIDSNFTNSTGLPDPDQYVTARDLATIARYLIEEHPDKYRYYGLKEFEWNGINQQNRNPLLRENLGADGLKTGSTSQAGFGLVGSAVQGQRRLILVLNGIRSSRDRAGEARRLMQWGFRAFESVKLFDADETVGTVRVYGGETFTVPVRGEGPIYLMMPRGATPDLRARIVYQGPIEAPIREGAQIARLVVFDGEKPILEQRLVAETAIENGPIHRQALDAGLEMIQQLWGKYTQ